MKRVYRNERCALLEEFATPSALSADSAQQLAARIEPRWWARGRCYSADPDAWFPETLARPQRLVGQVCQGCPVRQSCLADAVLGDEWGVWGGTRRGQRLHAKARLLAGDPFDDVFAELCASPVPRSEYSLPEPLEFEAVGETEHRQEWRKAS